MLATKQTKMSTKIRVEKLSDSEALKRDLRFTEFSVNNANANSINPLRGAMQSLKHLLLSFK